MNINENRSFTDYASGIRLPNCPKLAVNWKMAMTSQLFDMTFSSNFWRCIVFLDKFSHWSKFHVNIITGSGVMTISFYKGLTRNLEIGNTPDFAQNLETRPSKEYQIWHERLLWNVTESFKIPRLRLLLFLIY